MDWSILGALGEFVGGIAVVVSLLYVGLQVRQSSNSVRAASQIAIKQLSSEITTQLLAPDMARIYIDGLEDSSSLPPEDRVRFHSLMLSLFGTYEAAYFQTYYGTIPKEMQDPSRHQAQFHLRQPGVKQWWARGGRARFSQKFVEELEQAATTTTT
jgi:hypothetical protein